MHPLAEIDAALGFQRDVITIAPINECRAMFIRIAPHFNRGNDAHRSRGGRGLERALDQVAIEIRGRCVTHVARKPRLDHSRHGILREDLQRGLPARCLVSITARNGGGIDAAPVIEAQPPHQSDRAPRALRIPATARSDDPFAKTSRAAHGTKQRLR